MKLAIVEKNGEPVLLEASRLEVATIDDLIRSGCDDDFCGIFRDDEGNVFDSYTRLEINPATTKTMFYCVDYWDGSNNHVEVFLPEEISFVEAEITDRPDLEPNPKWYYVYEITIDGDKSLYKQSNMSGSLSPYYYPLEVSYGSY